MRQLFDYTAKFDGAELTADTILVTEEEIEEAYEQVDDNFLSHPQSTCKYPKLSCKTASEQLV